MLPNIYDIEIVNYLRFVSSSDIPDFYTLSPSNPIDLQSLAMIYQAQQVNKWVDHHCNIHTIRVRK